MVFGFGAFWFTDNIMRQVKLRDYIGSNADCRRLLVLKVGQRGNFVVANSPFCFL